MVLMDDFKIDTESSCTRKIYHMFCSKCGCDRGYQRLSREKSGLCKHCFGVIKHSGKIVSNETKLKMKQNNYLNNGGIHPLLGKKHSQKTKAKLSQKTTLQNKNYHGHFLYKNNIVAVYMRSSWEVLYAKWLDGNNIKWTYEPEFKLKDGRIYTADFKLEDDTIIEIKGYFRPDARIKWDMFSDDYPHINKKILMKDDLKKIGVL